MIFFQTRCDLLSLSGKLREIPGKKHGEKHSPRVFYIDFNVFFHFLQGFSMYQHFLKKVEDIFICVFICVF